MLRHFTSCALMLAVAAPAAAPALANPPSVVVISPVYPPGIYGAQSPGAPYSRPSFTIYPPGSINLPPQLSNPGANVFPPGAQTCAAPPYTCPASAPNTPGKACTCPTSGGGIISGIVR